MCLSLFSMMNRTKCGLFSLENQLIKGLQEEVAVLQFKKRMEKFYAYGMGNRWNHSAYGIEIGAYPYVGIFQ